MMCSTFGDAEYQITVDELRIENTQLRKERDTFHEQRDATLKVAQNLRRLVDTITEHPELYRGWMAGWAAADNQPHETFETLSDVTEAMKNVSQSDT